MFLYLFMYVYSILYNHTYIIIFSMHFHMSHIFSIIFLSFFHPFPMKTLHFWLPWHFRRPAVAGRSPSWCAWQSLPRPTARGCDSPRRCPGCGGTKSSFYIWAFLRRKAWENHGKPWENVILMGFIIDSKYFERFCRGKPPKIMRRYKFNGIYSWFEIYWTFLQRKSWENNGKIQV